MQDRDSLLQAYYKINHFDTKEVSSLVDSIHAYLEENGPDIKVEILLHALKTRIDIDLNNNFTSACTTAKFVVDNLQDKDWDIHELDLLTGIIGYIESFPLTMTLLNKALEINERKFKDSKNYDYRRYRLFFTICWRITRAKFFDNVEPRALKNLFDMYFNKAIKLCEKLNFFAPRTVLLVNTAIFDEDPVKIVEYLKALETTGDEFWITAAKDDVAEYVRHLRDKVDTPLYNYVVGWQIKKRRIELGLKTRDLADITDIPQTQINEVERGEKGVSIPRLFSIAYALKVEDLAYFFGKPSDAQPVITTDLQTHQMVQLMTLMSEPEKEYMVNLAKGYIEVSKKKKNQK